MITARDYTNINKDLIRKYKRAVRLIEKGKFGYDGTMPKECVKPMYESKIARHSEANQYLRAFAPEHTLTDDELYKVRAIINGRPYLH